MELVTIYKTKYPSDKKKGYKEVSPDSTEAEFIRDVKQSVLYQAFRFYRKIVWASCVDINDLIQEGYIGALEAFRKYDSSLAKKISFQLYIFGHIEYKIKNSLRGSTWTQSQQSATPTSIVYAEDCDKNLIEEEGEYGVLDTTPPVWSAPSIDKPDNLILVDLEKMYTFLMPREKETVRQWLLHNGRIHRDDRVTGVTHAHLKKAIEQLKYFFSTDNKSIWMRHYLRRVESIDYIPPPSPKGVSNKATERHKRIRKRLAKLKALSPKRKRIWG